MLYTVDGWLIFNVVIGLYDIAHILRPHLNFSFLFRSWNVQDKYPKRDDGMFFREEV